MIYASIITQTILAICFSYCLGSFILALVPKHCRPRIHLSQPWILIAVACIGLLSFVPVLQIILYIYSENGLMYIVQSVLFTFQVGKAWILLFIGANLLFIYVIWVDYREFKKYARIGLTITISLIAIVGWASHAGAYDPVIGFISHTIHYTAISAWCGILFIISWFSKEYKEWFSFIKWFTPFAIICVILTIISGLSLMNFSIADGQYFNSFLSSYGQVLFIKHLLILPLLFFALINGFLIKGALKQNNVVDIKNWLRAESFVVFLIFFTTAILGEQAPPHETVINQYNVSFLFSLFYRGTFKDNMQVVFEISRLGIINFVLSFIFLCASVYFTLKNRKSLWVFICLIFLVFKLYLGFFCSIK